MKWNWKHIFLLALVPLLLTACLDNEPPIDPPNLPGDLERVNFGDLDHNIYFEQVFFDLESGEVVSSNPVEAWDLKFDSYDGSFYIWLNYARAMRMQPSGQTNFIGVTTYSSGPDAEWNFDHPAGWPDSNAIGEWGDFSQAAPISLNKVYILDRGMTAPSGQRYKKIQLQEFDGGYKLRYANVNGALEGSITIQKDDNYGHIYFSFNDGGREVNIAPPKDQYSLVFTPFTSWVPDDAGDYYDYEVRGVLINPYLVEVAVELDTPWEDIDYEKAIGKTYFDRWDAIGYGWKSFDLGGTASYIVHPDVIYIVKDVDGTYYKIRFVDYTNASGQNGYPTFEYQRL